jgi:hypothetical protein
MALVYVNRRILHEQRNTLGIYSTPSLCMYFLYGYSPCMIKYFWRRLHVKVTPLNPLYAPFMLKYFFAVFSEYIKILSAYSPSTQKELRRHIKKFSHSITLYDSISKKSNGGFTYWLRKNKSQFLYLGYLKKMLSV